MKSLEKLWAEYKAKFLKADVKGNREAVHFKYAKDLMIQRGWQ